jgi:peroxiredoxin
MLKESFMPLLSRGDPFPSVELTLPGGQSLTLPDAFAGSLGVLLFYCGAWCPYCNAQLRAFQRAGDRLEEAGIKVAALSVDDEDTTAELVSKLGLTFPVGHSADPVALSAATGAFINPVRGHLETTGSVLDPSGKVVVSVYSSAAIGRLVPDNVIGFVRHLRALAA